MKVKVKQDLTGMRFGRLTVLGRDDDYVGPSGRRRGKWLCKCDCGKDTSVLTTRLRNNRTTSCGCFQKEMASISNTTHNLSQHKAYKTYILMMYRCYTVKDVTSTSYIYYKARGIKVEPFLQNTKNFCDFYDQLLLEYPGEDMSLDRIDNEAGYYRSNLRLASKHTQVCNRRLHKNNTSGYRGIHSSQHYNGWCGKITINGESYIMYAPTIKEAVEWRNNKIIELGLNQEEYPLQLFTD